MNSGGVQSMLKNNIELDVKVKCIEENITQVQIAKTVGTTAPYVCRILKAGDKVINVREKINVSTATTVKHRWRNGTSVSMFQK